MSRGNGRRGQGTSGRRLLALGAVAVVVAAATGAGVAIAAPGNDNFANAMGLSGWSVSVTGSIRGATKESGEPSHGTNARGMSVWFRWTAPASGPVTIDAYGSSFETRLAVYTGPIVSGLARVAQNDTVSGNTATQWSSVTFAATAGTTYSIALDTPGGLSEPDAYRLTVNPPRPANDDVANAQPLTGLSGSVAATNIRATREADEPALFAGDSLASVWYRFTAPKTGRYAFTTTGFDYGAVIGVYPTSGPRVPIATSGYGTGALLSATAGTAYLVGVAGGARDQKDFVLRWDPVRPANDDFASAEPISAGGGAVAGISDFATKEAGEPAHAGDPGGASVWYRFVPSATGRLRIAARPGPFTPILAAYTGSAVGSLTPRASSRSGELTVDVVSGTTYHLAVDGVGGESGSFELEWGAVRPPNDDYTDALPITGFSGTASMGMSGATLEPGEGFSHEMPSVWWRWTPAESGVATFDTWGSSHSAYISVFRGDTLATRLGVASDQESGGTGRSRVSFVFRAGETYRIRIQATREAVLNWRRESLAAPPLPGNDAYANAWPLAGEVGQTAGTRYGATNEQGEPQQATGTGSVWFRWTAPASGRVDVWLAQAAAGEAVTVYEGGDLRSLVQIGEPRTAGRWFDAVEGEVYTFRVQSGIVALGGDWFTLVWHREQLSPPNDYFSAAQLLTGEEGAVAATTYRASREVDEPVVPGCSSPCPSVWYRWVAPRSGTWRFELDDRVGYVVAYTGSSVRTLRPAGDDNGGWVLFRAQAGVTYWIAYVKGSLATTLRWAPGPPLELANDHFEYASPLEGERGAATGNNLMATVQPGEPSHGGQSLSSLWWRWTAPATGTYTFDTYGSGIRTALSVYRGDAVDGLVRLAPRSVSFEATVARATFGAVAGRTYYVAVASAVSERGPVHLNWKRQYVDPPNDRFGDAAVLAGTTGSVSGTSLGATDEPGEPAHLGRPAGASVWYRWTAPASGPVSFQLTGHSFNHPVLAAYTGTTLAGLQPVPANHDRTIEPRRIAFDAVAGTTYSFAVAGWSTDVVGAPEVTAGTFALSWHPRPANDDVAAAATLGGTTGSVAGTTVRATVQPGEPQTDWFSSLRGPSVWYRITPSASGTYTFDLAQYSSTTTIRVWSGTPFDGFELAGEHPVASNGHPFTAVLLAGRTYHVSVATWAGHVGSAFELRWSRSGPPNDAFAAPRILDNVTWAGVWETPVTVASANAGATMESGEPAHAPGGSGASVWFSWTSPVDAQVVADAAGTGFPAAVAVYTGSTVGALTRVGGDAAAGERQALASFAAVKGTTYRIAVDGLGGAVGSIRLTLRLAKPANDDFAGATPIPAAGVTVNTNGASREPGEPTHGGSNSASLWYTWTAPAAGTYSVTVSAPRVEPRVAVYAGTSLSSLQRLGQGAGSAGTAAVARFAAEAGQTVRIAIDGSRTGELVLTPPSAHGAPANDRFAAAQTLTGWEGSVTGSNQHATREPGEPEHGTGKGLSLWYRWTAPADGAVDFHVEQTQTSIAAFPQLTLYRGTSLASLTKLAPTGPRQRYAVRAGATYLIALDSDYVTPFALTWRRLAPPANDAFAAAESLPSASGTVLGTVHEASAEDGDPPFPTEWHRPAYATVWYSWTPPRDGRATIDVRPEQIGDPLGHVWLAVYTGDALTSLELVTSHRAFYSVLPHGRVQFDARAGTTYRIAAFLIHDDTIRHPDFRLNWSLQPPNDHFAAAFGISGEEGFWVAHNRSASKEPGEPDHAGNRGGASVWYRWTAPRTGLVFFETQGNRYDTLLAAYTGMSVGALTEVERDDQAGGLDDARLVFRAVAGTTYSIAVDGFYGPWWLTSQFDTATGLSTVHWRYLPWNDDFSSAERLHDRSGRIAGSNEGATKQPGEPAHAGHAGGASVWYSWTAGADGEVVVDTSGSGFDTLLAVYTGTTLGALTAVAANDDAAGGGVTSAVRFQARAGTTYRIAVDGKGGATGRLFVNWSLAAAPPNDDFARASSVSGMSGEIRLDTRYATREPGEPVHAGVQGGGSVWFRWAPPTSSGEVVVDTTGVPAGTRSIVAVYRGSALGSLELLGSDSGGVDGHNSRVAFTATGGEVYVAVDTEGGKRAAFTLRWNPRPRNDNRRDATEIGGTHGSVTGTNRTATVEVGEQGITGLPPAATVWWAWTAPTTGRVTFDTVGSEGVTRLARGQGSGGWTLFEQSGHSSGISFDAQAGQRYHVVVDGDRGAIRLNWRMALARPANDDLRDAFDLPAPGFMTPYCDQVCTNHAATTEPGEPDHGGSGHTVWARHVATADGVVEARATAPESAVAPVLAVYEGPATGFAGLRLVARGTGASTGEVRASFRVQAGRTYHFAIDTLPRDGGAAPTTTGRVGLELSGVTGAPANDDFAAAQPANGLDGTVTGTTFGATQQEGEPRLGTGRTVWYTLTAPAPGGRTTLTTRWNDSLSSGPYVAVYEGAWGNLTRLAENPDAVRSVTFRARPGATYHVQVDGTDVFGSAHGAPFTLTWSTVRGAYFDTPIALDGRGGSVTGSTAGSLKEPLEPAHAGNPGGHSIWFRWTAPASGRVELTTEGSSFDTLLAAYRGSALGALELVAANDDDGQSPTSRIAFQAQAGTTYRIALDGYGGVNGDYRLAFAMGDGDSTPPTVRVTSPTEGQFVGGSFLVSVDAQDDDAVAEVELLANGVSVGRDTTAPYTVLWDTRTTPDGPAVLTARAVDRSGNAATASVGVTVDNTAPTPRITGTPPTPHYANTEATFTFEADEPVYFLCRVDDEPWEPCLSPKSFTGLTPGRHTFGLQAIDRAGLVGGTAHAWTVEDPVPTVTFTSTPPAQTTERRATFAFTASRPGSVFSCRLDDGVWTACSSPVTTPELAVGVHRFSVRATAPDGTPSADALHTWEIVTGETSPANLIPNGDFESGVTGWRSWNGTLSAVAGRTGGGARATANAGATAYSLFPSPRPVAVESDGAYSATAWVRGRAGATLCLYVREWTSGIVGSQHRCATATGSWQQLGPVTHSASAGSTLEAFVQANGVQAGDAFDADDVVLVRGTGTPPPPDPEPEPTANLIPNGDFSNGVTGWRSWNGTVTAVDGRSGGGARATANAGVSAYSLFPAPRPVSVEESGAYTATAWVRGRVGATLCLYVREWTTSPVGHQHACVTATGSWQQVGPVTHGASAGSTLEAFVQANGAQAGDAFDADDVVLVRGTGTPPPPDPEPEPTANLIPNGDFSNGVTGWRSWNGTVTAVDGRSGGGARATANAGASAYSLFPSPRPVSVDESGAYTATAWVRGRAGATLCLYVREWTTGVVGSQHACATATGDWQQLGPVTHSASAGSTLEAFVQANGAQAGDAFDADDVVLVRGGSATPPPPPPPPPPAPSNLIPNGDFENGVTGWRSWNGTVTAVTGRSGGGARAAANGGATAYSLFPSPRPVQTEAGQYAATAWVKGRAGATLCLYVREWGASGVAGSQHACATATGDWQQLGTVTHTAAAGNELEAFVMATGAQPGDAFDADDVRLWRP